MECGATSENLRLVWVENQSAMWNNHRADENHCLLQRCFIIELYSTRNQKKRPVLLLLSLFSLLPPYFLLVFKHLHSLQVSITLLRTLPSVQLSSAQLFHHHPRFISFLPLCLHLFCFIPDSMIRLPIKDIAPVQSLI